MVYAPYLLTEQLCQLSYFYIAMGIVLLGYAYYRFRYRSDECMAPEEKVKSSVSFFSSENMNRLFHSRFLMPLIVIILAVIPFTELSSRSYLDTTMTILIYIMLGWGLNIIVGLAGLLDLGFVAFYAVGAYSYALLAHYFGLGFWLSLPLAGLFAACFGFLLGYPILRLRGDYFAIVTLGFGEIIRLVLVNWDRLTGGPNGISGIPKPSLGDLHLTRRIPEGGSSFHEYFGISYSSSDKYIFLYLIILLFSVFDSLFYDALAKDANRPCVGSYS